VSEAAVTWSGMGAPSLLWSVRGAGIDTAAVSPAIALELGVEAPAGVEVRSVLLRAQVRIAVRRRGYDAATRERLYELFGEPSQWGRSLRDLQWAHATAMVPPFEGRSSVVIQLPCSYDFETGIADPLGTRPRQRGGSRTIIARLHREPGPGDQELARRYPRGLRLIQNPHRVVEVGDGAEKVGDLGHPAGVERRDRNQIVRLRAGLEQFAQARQQQLRLDVDRGSPFDQGLASQAQRPEVARHLDVDRLARRAQRQRPVEGVESR